MSYHNFVAAAGEAWLAAKECSFIVLTKERNLTGRPQGYDGAELFVISTKSEQYCTSYATTVG